MGNTWLVSDQKKDALSILFYYLKVQVKVNFIFTAPWWDLTDTVLNVNPLRRGVS